MGGDLERCVMRRETGNSEKKKKKQRWRLTAARHADEQFMEDVMLKEGEPFEVKEVMSVLQGLSSSCEERESSFAFKTRTEGGENAP